MSPFLCDVDHFARGTGAVAGEAALDGAAAGGDKGMAVGIGEEVGGERLSRGIPGKSLGARLMDYGIRQSSINTPLAPL